jgi:uncharacterized protein (TIGR03000 family)
MGKRFVLVPILALAAILILADFQKAQAQRWRRGGGYFGGYGGNGYYGNSYYGNGYYSYGDGMVRGGYFGDGYGNSYYGNGFYGNGYNSNAYPYWRNGYYDNTGYWRDGITDGYWYTSDNGNTYVDDQGYQVAYAPGGSAGGGCYSNYSGAGNQAHIIVRLDTGDAKVWFDDHATKQRGMNRMFDTPALEQGVHTYHVRAKWKENGQDMDETRVVRVRPGQSVTVDFTQYTVNDQTIGNNHRTGNGNNGNNNNNNNNNNQKRKNSNNNQKSRQQPD